MHLSGLYANALNQPRWRLLAIDRLKTTVLAEIGQALQCDYRVFNFPKARTLSKQAAYTPRSIHWVGI